MTKRIILAVFLGMFGYFGNLLDLPMAYGVSFIFGSIFSILALRFLGVGWALGVAVIASSYTISLWNHPYAIIIFTCEIAWLGFWLRRGRVDLLLLDALYWVTLGIPLVGVFYQGVMQLGWQAAGIIALKQSLNGVLNTLVAVLLVYLYSLINRKSSNQVPVVSYANSTFHLTAAFLIIPSLSLFLLASYQDVANQEQRVAAEIRNTSESMRAYLNDWIMDHVETVEAIANLVPAHSLHETDFLQGELERFSTMFPDFHNFYIGDASATTVAFYPEINAQGESTIGLNFSDRSYFKRMAETGEPVVSDVFMGRGGVFFPIFVVGVPVFAEGELHHFGLGAINLDRLSNYLDPMCLRSDLILTLLDDQGRIVVSTDPGHQAMDYWGMEGTSSREVSPEVFLQVPGTPRNISIMQGWKDAVYITRRPVTGTPWKLVVEYPVGPLRELFYISSNWSLGVVFIIFAIMIPVASFSSQRLVRPLEELVALSKVISHTLDAGDDIIWPVSRTQEVIALTDHFSLTAEALRERIVQASNAKEHLEEIVAERTQELSDQQQRLAQIIEATGVGTWEWNVQKDAVQVNERWAQICGRRHSELESATFEALEKFTHPEDLQISQGKRDRHFKGESSTYDCEYRIRHTAGHWIWVLDRGQVISWTDDGEPLLMLGTRQEITERKIIEEKLRESEERFREMFHRHGAVMLLIDPDSGAIIDANQSAEKFYGMDREDLDGIAIQDINLLEEGLVLEKRQSALQEDCKYFIFPHRVANGAVRTVEVYSTPILVGGDKLLFSIIHDITDRQRMQTDLEIATKEAIEANQAKSEFLANMSHEIRTPLNGVTGLAQLLSLTPLSVDQAKYVNGLQVCASNLLSIINNVLDFSKIEAGITDLEESAFNPVQCFEEVVLTLKSNAQAKGLALELDLDPQLPSGLEGDHLRFKQILLNLVGNALKFTHTGGVEISVRVLNCADGQLELETLVSDSGIGISDEAKEIIFDAFRQEDGSTTRRYGGTGLGLAISRRLAESMGGGLTVDSSSEDGSVFSLKLPFTIANEGEVMAAAPPTSALEWPHPPLKILYVEDESVNAAVAVGILEKIGHEVHVSEDGRSCLDALSSDSFDLVLMDIQMIEMDGIQTLNSIRGNRGLDDIPVIALTAFALRGDKERILAEGFDAYVSKPIDFGELLGQMKKVLDLE